MGKRYLNIHIERELVMRSAELATAAGMATTDWIGATLASAIEARSDATPKSGAAEGESAVPKADAQ